MTEHRREAPGENAPPVPRDMPDQQARTGEDPWEVAESSPRRSARNEPGTDEDVPDTDEAGTGRQGAPNAANVHPEHPAPQEPPG
ncbi:hypothetical protein [Streptomyces carpinensis]|uniref:Uncharacterized protein n=1 Tax=Streptomyces carpinensis TaxID=66369 RepID=A0ABV1WA72_9ACTN|nr:hypothetical protein [Streptomyces carpinensis]